MGYSQTSKKYYLKGTSQAVECQASFCLLLISFGSSKSVQSGGILLRPLACYLSYPGLTTPLDRHLKKTFPSVPVRFCLGNTSPSPLSSLSFL